MTTTKLPDDMSLGRARDWLKARVRKGERCPCCTQFAKTYARQVTDAMACTLIGLYRMQRWQKPDEETWVHIDREVNEAGRTAKKSRDYSKLRYWGLIERHETEQAKWRITVEGIQFVEKRKGIPRYALVYDNRCLGTEGDEVMIDFCLGKAFDYAELMRS